jgi:hypothetical protein
MIIINYLKDLKRGNSSTSNEAHAKTKALTQLLQWLRLWFPYYYGCCFLLPSRISSSSSMMEVAVRLNSDNVFPNADPISGSFLGPKMIKAMIIMRINPGMPIFESICSSS